MSPMPGYERLVNFSDAVVAIAATLLILPLVDIASDLDDTRVADLLRDNGHALTALALSFFVIARFWVSHNAIFAALRGYTPVLVWANLVWLASIVFLPFPTELVSRSGTADRLTSTVYIGTLTLTAGAAAVMQWLAVRSPELQTDEARGTLELFDLVVTAAGLAVALGIAAAVPGVGLKSLLLLVALGPLGRVRRARSRRA